MVLEPMEREDRKIWVWGTPSENFWSHAGFEAKEIAIFKSYP